LLMHEPGARRARTYGRVRWADQRHKCDLGHCDQRRKQPRQPCARGRGAVRTPLRRPPSRSFLGQGAHRRTVNCGKNLSAGVTHASRSTATCPLALCTASSSREELACAVSKQACRRVAGGGVRAAGAHGQLRPGQRGRQVAQREQAAVREAAVARGLQVLLCLSPVLLARAVCAQFLMEDLTLYLYHNEPHV